MPSVEALPTAVRKPEVTLKISISPGEPAPPPT